MPGINFNKIKDWKAFERLIADLLELEGFRIMFEPSVDRKGFDILAEETIKSHSGLSHTFKWFIQCKHYSKSGKNLGKYEVNKILYDFSAYQKANALLIITDSDISETAYESIDDHVNNRESKNSVKVWNKRELENRLIKYPTLAEKYGISKTPDIKLNPFSELETGDSKILVISDGSPLAYQTFLHLYKNSINVKYINYIQFSNKLTRVLQYDNLLKENFDLIIFFLGDTFGIPISRELIKLIIETVDSDKGLIFFPFFAWTLEHKINTSLEKMIPVKLTSLQNRDRIWLKYSRIYSKGDLSWLNGESFIENQAVNIATDNKHPILKDINGSIDITHSFEFLDVKSNGNCILYDNNQTPFLIENNSAKGRVIYINSCMHNCLTNSPLLSPFDTSINYQKILVNSIKWCLKIID